MIRKIRTYTHWEISLHENQGYLGRCVVWCKRKDALDLADATAEEREELFLVLAHLRTALTEAFHPDWFNYAFLGNNARHLHCHVIPRYASVREFAGQTFRDDRYGHNYRTDHDFSVPDSVMTTILNMIIDSLRAMNTNTRSKRPWE